MTQKELNEQTLLDAQTLLHEAGILDLVTVSLEDQQMENGKHITVLAGSYEDVYGNSVHTEVLNSASKYLNMAKIFTMFFTQRIDWLKAPHSQKADAMDKNVHPAFFAEEYLKKVDMPGFEGTLDALDILSDIKTITDDYASKKLNNL